MSLCTLFNCFPEFDSMYTYENAFPWNPQMNQISQLLKIL